MGYPVIDNNLCTMCGKCISICPKAILSTGDDRIVLSVDECMLCSHCYSVCPHDAISFNPEDLKEVKLTSVKKSNIMAEQGEMDPALLVRFLRSRRSIRHYKDKPVPDNVLKDLVACAVLAPSGSNCQSWEFTIVNGREKVWNIAMSMKNFFVMINRLAANPFVRYLSVPFIGLTLVRFNRDHRQSVEMALVEAGKGRDLLFHGAPSMFILHSTQEASLPREDAQYASYHISLLAHAMGLGTCYIGFASEALNHIPSLKKRLMIPKKNKVYAVLVLGYPSVKFRRGSLRKPWKENRI